MEKGAGRSQNHGIVWVGKKPLEIPGDTEHARVGAAVPVCLSQQFLMERFLLSQSFLPHPPCGEGRQRLQLQRGLKSSFAWQGEPEAARRPHPGWFGRCLMP